MRRHIIPFLMLICGMTNAQTVLTGHVVDTTDSPLPDIKVLAYKTNSHIIVAYTATDINGAYTLNVSTEADSLDLAVNSIFFERKKKPLPTAARPSISSCAKKCSN